MPRCRLNSARSVHSGGLTSARQRLARPAHRRRGGLLLGLQRPRLGLLALGLQRRPGGQPPAARAQRARRPVRLLLLSSLVLLLLLVLLRLLVVVRRGGKPVAVVLHHHHEQLAVPRQLLHEAER